MLSEYPTNSLTSVEQFANPRMPVASTIILDATQLVADDAASATTLKSTMLKLQKRQSYLGDKDGHAEDIQTISDLIVKVKQRLTDVGRSANLSVDTALSQIANPASGARANNAAQQVANAEQTESTSLDVPFPDAVGDPNGDSVQDLLDEIDAHTNGMSGPSMPDQIGCLQILVNKLTMDGRLKDAEIARLNDALSAREV